MDIGQIVGAHNMWKMRFENAIQNGTKVSADVVAADDQCPFGKWLISNPIDESVKALHKEFHRVAGEIAHKIENNCAYEASLLMNTDFEDVSKRLVRALQGTDVSLPDGSHPFNLDVSQACVPSHVDHRLRFES